MQSNICQSCSYREAPSVSVSVYPQDQESSVSELNTGQPTVFKEETSVSVAGGTPESVDSSFSYHYNEKKNTKEVQSMSYAHAFKFKNTLLFASDSRCIYQNNGERWYTDNFQKIGYLENMKLGFASTGTNVFNGIPLVEFLKKNDEENGSFEKNFSFLAERIRQELKENESVNLVCGGYERGVALLQCAEISKKIVDFTEVSYMWNSGSGVPAKNLFLNNEGNIETNVETIGDLIQFSDFLIQTEIEKCKFLKRFPSVGGPVQTLLLTEDGPEWIHKIR